VCHFFSEGGVLLGDVGVKVLFMGRSRSFPTVVWLFFSTASWDT